MDTYEEELINLIKPVFDCYGFEMKAANETQLRIFEEIALKNGLPQKGIKELKRFYKVTNGIPEIEVHVHDCEDELIYEFWGLNKQLWIGQRDMDMLSWKEGNFHLGCAGELNYGNEYIFENLLDLLKKGFRDWFISTDGKFPHKK